MVLLIEFILFLSLLSATIFGFSSLFNSSSFEARRVNTINRTYDFENAFRSSFVNIIDTVRNNCDDGYDTSSCSGTSPLPDITDNGDSVVITYSISSTLPDRNNLVSLITGLYNRAKCDTSDDGSNLTVFCRNVRLINYQNVPVNILDIDTIPRYTFSFSFMGANGNYIWLKRDIDLSDIYESRRELNKNLFIQIADVLRSYQSRRLTEEKDNICGSGGLKSSDDIYIPWIMQGYTINQNSLCNSNDCNICSNIDWSSINQNDRNSQLTLINNLTGGSIKLVDYFGNKIEVFALVDSSDNPYTPPNPSTGYPYKPPYTGLIRINNNFDCVSNKKNYCYFKFVYNNN